MHFEPGHILPSAPGDESLAFAFSGGRMLLRSSPGGDDKPLLPTLGELRAAGFDGGLHYLGALDGVACVAINLERGAEAGVAPSSAVPTLPDGWRASGLRPLFPLWPEPLIALAGRAFQVVEWDRTHRFCGVCGTPTGHKPGERARECPACGYTMYPRVSPAMMVLITRGRMLLLARATRFPTAMFSALAGFVEPGETVEDCVRREVREEVGLEVHDPLYFGSQSWAFPHSLMIAFTAEYAGGELRPDQTEIAEARWFDPEALPHRPSSISIAHRLIEATARRLAALPR